MSIAGKYIHVGEEGFMEYMAKEGVPPERMAEMKGKGGKNEYDIKLDGNKVILTHAMGDRPPRTTEYVLGQPIEEKMGDNRVIKSTATLAGSVLTVVSVGPDGKERSRIYKFSDSGLHVIHKSSHGEGKLIYKRE